MSADYRTDTKCRYHRISATHIAVQSDRLYPWLEPQLQQVIAQINGLQNRIRYSQTDYDNTKARSIADILRDIEQLEQNRSIYDPQIEEIKGRMESREEHLSELKKQHETVEDEVFLTFCQQVRSF